METKQLITDQELVKMIKSGGKPFEQASNYLFRAHLGYIPTIKAKMHLSQDDLRDAYSDSLVKMIRHIKQGLFRGESKISTYFYKIFQNGAVDVLRKHTSNKNQATAELHEYSAVEKNLLSTLEINDEAKQVKLQINNLGNPCKGILMDWAYFGFDMKEIAVRNKLSNAESARSMKYKCLKKLRSLIQSLNLMNDGI